MPAQGRPAAVSACPNCNSADLVKIDVVLQGGPTRFSHCHRCEHRWWVEGGERSDAPELPLGRVLDMARKSPRPE